jgi:hypothetical protein
MRTILLSMIGITGRESRTTSMGSVQPGRMSRRMRVSATLQGRLRVRISVLMTGSAVIGFVALLRVVTGHPTGAGRVRAVLRPAIPPSLFLGRLSLVNHYQGRTTEPASWWSQFLSGHLGTHALGVESTRPEVYATRWTGAVVSRAHVDPMAVFGGRRTVTPQRSDPTG